MATLRAVDPRLAGQLSRALAPLQSLRMRVQDALQPIADATPMLSHRSCRKVAVLAPRWRKLRDRTALDALLVLVAVIATTTASVAYRLGNPCAQVKRTEPLTASPPLADRYEPAHRRGPPASHHPQMRGSVAAGNVTRTHTSDMAAVRHTTASASDLTMGGDPVRR
jgi:hypothetical protein